jgi:hypothetical protein
MIEVLRTNNAIRLDYALLLLRQAGCNPFVADRFMASAEGGISAFERRIMVPDQHEARAREVLKDLDAPIADDLDDEYGDEPA